MSHAAPQFESKLHIFNSNSMEVLAQIVARLISSRPLSSPFASEQIVVANQGMANFLTLTVADSNQICANLHYVKLWDLIWGTLRSVFPQAGTVNRFSHEHLTWSIFSLKERWGSSELSEADQCLAILGRYLEDDEDGTKAFALSSKIADTFDQYQMYRHDWIEAFNTFTDEDFVLFARNPEAEGRIKNFLKSAATVREHFDGFLYETLKDNLWQARLWTLLRNNLDPQTFAEGEDPRFASTDRASCILRLCQELEQGGQTLSGLPERIFIFGISTMSPLELHFVRSLASRIRVYYLLLNPCSDYWGDLRSDWLEDFASFKALTRHYSHQRVISSAEASERELQLENMQEVRSGFEPSPDDYDDKSLERVEGHPLLLSLGREEMELLSRVLDDEQNVNFYDAFVEPECDSMLHEVQRSILNAFKPQEQQRAKPCIDAQDNSVVIHSCHTIRRQVEVLRDALLWRFKQAGGKLRLRDCVVMVPDIEEYTPYIHAVFGSSSQEDERYLPYAISDRSEANESQVAQAVLQLLALGRQRVTASLVMELLTVPSLAEKFMIKPEDLEIISRWCQETRLYWGLDDEEVRRELSSTEEIRLPWTFERALMRMLQGYMTGEIEGRADLYTAIEGDDAELLGRFYAFVSSLVELRELFTPSFNVKLESQSELELDSQSWMRIIEEQVIARFFVQNEQTELELEQLRGVVEAMEKAIYNLKLKPQITLPVFEALLQRRLGTAPSRQPKLGDFINFCSLVPMRAVPFKHVFILGLNEGVFPRQDQEPAFNLTSQPKLRRKGDRSRGADDRLLFLEALLSAEESLELFYIGVRPENQQSCVPSVVLSELLDFCSDYFRLPDEDSSATRIQERLIRQETMAPYNEQNYRLDDPKRLPSFDRAHFIAAQAAQLTIPSSLGECLDYTELVPCAINYEFDCERLSSVLEHPCRAFLRDTLDLRLNLEADSSLNDDEPLALSSYEEGPLVKDLLPLALMKDGELRVQDMLSSYKRGGILPYGQLGELTAQQLLAAVHSMQKGIGALLGENGTPQQVSYDHELKLQIKGVEYTCLVRGQVSCPYVYPQAFSTNVVSARLALHQLCASLALYLGGQRPCTSYAVSLDGRMQQCDVTWHPELSPEEILEQCCRWYVRAHLGPLPFNGKLLRAVSKLKQPEPDKLEAQLLEAISMDNQGLDFVFSPPAYHVQRPEVTELLAEGVKFYSEVIMPCMRDEEER